MEAEAREGYIVIMQETSDAPLFLYIRDVKANVTPSAQAGAITFEGNLEQGQST